MTQNDAKNYISFNNAHPNFSGDVTGLSNAVTVGRIQNIPIQAGTPTNNYILTYVAADSDWEPAAQAAATTNPSPLIYNIVTSSASSYVLQATDIIVVLTNNSVSTLPVTSGTTIAGRVVYLINTHSGVTITMNGTTSISGGAIGSTCFICVDGTNWIVNDNL